jgi:hypothetical protein
MESWGYPLKSFPIDFQQEKIVELHMPCSPIKQLFKGIEVRFFTYANVYSFSSSF